MPNVSHIGIYRLIQIASYFRRCYRQLFHQWYSALRNCLIFRAFRHFSADLATGARGYGRGCLYAEARATGIQVGILTPALVRVSPKSRHFLTFGIRKRDRLLKIDFRKRPIYSRLRTGVIRLRVCRAAGAYWGELLAALGVWACPDVRDDSGGVVAVSCAG